MATLCSKLMQGVLMRTSFFKFRELSAKRNVMKNSTKKQRRIAIRVSQLIQGDIRLLELTFRRNIQLLLSNSKEVMLSKIRT